MTSVGHSIPLFKLPIRDLARLLNHSFYQRGVGVGQSFGVLPTAVKISIIPSLSGTRIPKNTRPCTHTQASRRTYAHKQTHKRTPTHKRARAHTHNTKRTHTQHKTSQHTQHKTTQHTHTHICTLACIRDSQLSKKEARYRLYAWKQHTRTHAQTIFEFQTRKRDTSGKLGSDSLAHAE